jgi:hypothetical protein
MESGRDVVIYSGELSEALFLKSLLEGSGIPATIKNFSIGIVARADILVCVAPDDVVHAQELVDDFRRRGKMTPPG